jgi:hypothetical protein
MAEGKWVVYVGNKPNREYKAGLVKTSSGRKFAWQLAKNVDALSPEVYEFEKISAPSKAVAVRKLNDQFKQKYGNRISKQPFY